MDYFYASESYNHQDDEFSHKNYLIRKSPRDYVTITYRDDEGNQTGGLKIFTLDEVPAIDPRGKTMVLAYSKTFNLSDKCHRTIYEDLTIRKDDTINRPYPLSYRYAIKKYLQRFSTKYEDFLTLTKDKDGNDTYAAKELKLFYDRLVSAMPLLMAYRYYT